jgi:hypothetical protein
VWTCSVVAPEPAPGMTMTVTTEPTCVEMLSAFALVTMLTWIFITMLQDLSGAARYRGGRLRG